MPSPSPRRSTDNLRSSTGAGRGPDPAPPTPKEFEGDAFLQQAKQAFRQVQTAWDHGDLAELRALTTDAVFGELQDQIKRRGEGEMAILSLHARLLEVVDLENGAEASVLFDAVLAERGTSGPAAPAPVPLSEVWYFVRPKRSLRPSWYLDGVERVTH